MAYGLKYQTQFTSQSDENTAEKDYRLQFWFKGYSGDAVSITGGDVTVVQRATTDDPFAPIKGQSLDITLLNKNNSLSITAFQSNLDDDILVKLLDSADNVLFTGYLVQDDFYETKVDFEHYITLTANDGLGLLRGIILSDARIRRRFGAHVRTNGALDEILLSIDDDSFYINAGDILEVLGVVYTVVSVDTTPITLGGYIYQYTVTVSPSAAGTISPQDDVIYLTGRVNLLNKNSLLTIIGLCLYQTNLSLMTSIWHTLFEYMQDETRSTFEQTLIDAQLFIEGETYKNCYDVLELVMKTFNCQVFQANNQWQIVNWHEAKNYNNALRGFLYDETITYMGQQVLNNTFLIGNNQLSRPIYPLTEGALRGYKFSRKKFAYNQPKYLLRNYDLKTLGALIRQYNYAGNIVSEYVATGWENSWPVGTQIERFIRVTRDTAGSELDRALVLRGPTGDTSRAVQGTPFEVSEGDKIKFSFTFQTNNSQAGPLTIIFGVRLTDGTNNRYVDEVPVDNGSWIGGLGFNYSISGGDDTNILHTVEIASSQVPFSGLIYCYLAQAILTPSATDETWYRDIRLEYTPFINDSSKITGQIHKQQQPLDIKNNSDLDIYADDSPRNSIVGTLFRNTKTGLLQNRTQFWRYPVSSDGWRLGERTTLQDLMWRQKTRTKFEGDFIGNYQNGGCINLLSVLNTSFYPTKNFVFGLFNIDYKKNKFGGTLWEVYDVNDEEVDNTYTLEYIYEAK